MGELRGIGRVCGRYARAAVVSTLIVTTGATLGALAPTVSDATTARVARSMYVSESGRLYLTSTGNHGFTLNEVGSASGTIRGTIYIHLHLEANNGVWAEVNIYPRSGSLTGYGSASYRVLGAYASFAGSFTVARGTGRYGHARGSGLRFAGTIQRRTDAVSVRLSGWLSV